MKKKTYKNHEFFQLFMGKELQNSPIGFEKNREILSQKRGRRDRKIQSSGKKIAQFVDQFWEYIAKFVNQSCEKKKNK